MPIHLWTCVPKWFKGVGDVKACWLCDGHQSSWELLGPKSICNRQRPARAKKRAHLMLFLKNGSEQQYRWEKTSKQKFPKQTNMARHLKLDLPKKSKDIGREMDSN